MIDTSVKDDILLLFVLLNIQVSIVSLNFNIVKHYFISLITVNTYNTFEF